MGKDQGIKIIKGKAGLKAARDELQGSLTGDLYQEKHFDMPVSNEKAMNEDLKESQKDNFAN